MASLPARAPKPGSEPPPDLRPYLPGLEPERRVTDWGRSERLEAVLDTAVSGPLFNLWHRARVEGMEHVPPAGGALLVANRAGALPTDSLLVMKAVAGDAPGRRAVVPLVDPGLLGVPGLAMLLPKIGAVADHPANVRRLLGEERELVLTFPEGGRGARKPFRDRYRLRRFDAEAVRPAFEAGVPVVPVAILGTEESAPTFLRVPIPGRGSLPLSLPVSLPSRIVIRFLPAIDGGAASPHETASAVGETIQAALYDLVGARRSVWFG